VSEVYLDPQPLFDAVAGAFDAAGDEVVTQISGRQVRRSGFLASSYGISPSRDDGRWWWAYVASAARYALPVERGAWVGAGHNRAVGKVRSGGGTWGRQRGPHMKGNFLIKRNIVAIYGAAMKAALPAGYRPRRTVMRPIPGTVIR
jgi:hypothetical protein